MRDCDADALGSQFPEDRLPAKTVSGSRLREEFFFLDIPFYRTFRKRDFSVPIFQAIRRFSAPLPGPESRGSRPFAF
jgi:hypothetical protein